ncbi:MAG: two-component sensor histidine kinase [Desulfobacterales bacterium]|nr:two-component sensor histidine kinase [Desulfobacterales bacterium]
MTTTKATIATSGLPIEGSDRRREQYKRFFRRFVLLTLVSSLVPLLLVGWGINVHYTRFARERLTEKFNREVDNHHRAIELFFKEHSSKLQLMARTHSKEYLSHPGNLNKVFELINHDHPTLTDLGLIDHTGRHLAYVGPYDLMDKNYADAFWFQQVLKKGIFISDMFLGFRREPHFIMAVTSSENGEPWILRATINTETFRALVENVRIGKSGEVYLLNTEGIYQTTPRFGGAIMEVAPLPLLAEHQGTDLRFVTQDYPGRSSTSSRRIVCSVWLKEPRWLLVVTQSYDEAFNAVNHANFAVLVFLLISALTILIVAVLVTRHMLTMIRRRDRESDQLNQQLMQTSKLASIGELSAGVAHEINNPLAIISTERQILLDCAKQTGQMEVSFQEQFNDSMSQIDIQIQRCKRITHNLLRFSRRTQSVMETVHLNAFILEVVDLMEREARASGIKFVTTLEPELPVMISDPSQLQQLFLNLITNAIDAHDGKPYGRVEIATTGTADGQGVRLSISDTGCGISAEHMEKIFDPFFTTKPVGKGTGLGLSICFSIIQRLGGRIDVHSEPGQGTRFDIELPLHPPAEMMQYN